MIANHPLHLTPNYGTDNFRLTQINKKGEDALDIDNKMPSTI